MARELDDKPIDVTVNGVEFEEIRTEHMETLANAGKESTHPDIYRVFPLLDSDDMSAAEYMEKLKREIAKKDKKDNNRQLMRAALIYTWFCCKYQEEGPIFKGKYEMRRQNAQVGSEEDKRKQIENITDDWENTFSKKEDDQKIFEELARHISRVNENLNGKAMDYLVMLFCPLLLDFKVSYNDPDPGDKKQPNKKEPDREENEQTMLAASLALDILREQIRRTSNVQASKR